jgi:predicted GNAT family acetyltransferase
VPVVIQVTQKVHEVRRQGAGNRPMTAHILDQPIRNALLTCHKNLSEGGPLALRYPPDISPFATAVDDSAEALAALAALIPSKGMAMLVQAGNHLLPPGAVAESSFQVVQMVAGAVTAPEAGIEVLELSDADAPEMLSLATLTRPGPYNSRTHAFGGYIGIREGGRLAAMAGLRLKVPGYTEISAVCTHPDFRGRGYAGHLTQVVAARIAARGETPFLHTYAANVTAIRLYERLGFALRCHLAGIVLRHA